MRPDFITVGEIVAPHGYRGALKVLPLTDFPERFLGMKEAVVFLKGQRTTYTVKRARLHGKFVLLELVGVERMEEAEALRGGLVQVPREEVHPLPPGHYYIFDLIGMEVFTEEGTFLGKIEAVLSTRANDVFSVRSPKGKEILIPALKTVVCSVDVPGRKMTVKLPEGLL
ncbi:ribosome maturation factor RimM [Ammonifex thiophilus]|uniref:Ribosome maturation factor RimM n=1 Tax=Ammonifex thiophilus TaxID=444093 RepID=A0A3D8P169_9THEO|nr:ribosome maturation factor RimM [Ammonifex thiophilus]RDV81155.1 16S rRNA processing protein RimM [Ammonifex thiophilus]